MSLNPGPGQPAAPAIPQPITGVPTTQDYNDLLALVQNLNTSLQTAIAANTALPPPVLPLFIDPANMGTAEIKAKIPDTYDGKSKGEVAENFMSQVEMYARLQSKKFQQEQPLIAFTINCLGGTALSWAKYISKEIVDKGDNTQLVEAKHWYTFKNEFLRIFGDNDKEASAIRELKKLTQTKSATDYTSEFSRIAMNIQWNEAALMDHYWRGLKDNVKDTLVLYDKPGNLNDLKQLAIRIDTRLWERQKEKTDHRSHDYRPVQRANHAPAPRQAPLNPGPSQQAPSSTRDPDAMDLSAVQARRTFAPRGGRGGFRGNGQRQRLSQEERDRRFKEGACYKCGKQGHRAFECPNGATLASVEIEEPSAEDEKEQSQGDF